jgi:hypothetical protein
MPRSRVMGQAEPCFRDSRRRSIAAAPAKVIGVTPVGQSFSMPIDTSRSFCQHEDVF